MSDDKKDPAPAEAEPAGEAAAPARWPYPVGITVVVLSSLLGGQLLYARAAHRPAAAPLASRPRPVTVVTARVGRWQDDRRYIGTLEPWVQANVGPELVSAHVRAVSVRPGDTVRAHQVLATLDCRHVSTAVRANAATLQAARAQEQAHSSLAERYRSLAPQGFVADNDVLQQTSLSEADRARAQAAAANVASTRVAEDDCTLEAPFDGEVGARLADPGAFARPGSPLLTVLDRRVVRATAEVPETDFALVAPGTPMRLTLLASGQRVEARVSRRSPQGDAATRTVHLELDLPNAERSLPVNTTVELHLAVGTPREASTLPLAAAQVRGSSARLFVLEGDVARQRSVPVLGEREGTLYVTGVPEGARVVTEGRTLLEDGQRVAAREATPAPEAPR